MAGNATASHRTYDIDSIAGPKKKELARKHMLTEMRLFLK